jgi:hypothetical protein
MALAALRQEAVDSPHSGATIPAAQYGGDIVYAIIESATGQSYKMVEKDRAEAAAALEDAVVAWLDKVQRGEPC